MEGLFSFLKDKRMVYMGSAALAAYCVALVKDQTQGGQFKNKIRATGKVVVITGANTGIGKETAREMAKRGAHVYMACRDMEKCEAAREEIVIESKNQFVYCQECDLASFASIRNFVKKLVIFNYIKISLLKN